MRLNLVCLIGLSCWQLASHLHVAAADASGESVLSGIEIHGFASLGYLKSSENNYLGQTKTGSLEFNEFGINFRAELDDSTSYGLQLFSRDLGELGNNEIVIDWGFLDHHINDKVGIRIGRSKNPASLYNEYQDIDAVRTTILMPQGLYGSGFRDTSLSLDGVTAYGNIETENKGGLEYNVYYGIINIPKNGSIPQALGTDEADTSVKYTVGGNLI